MNVKVIRPSVGLGYLVAFATTALATVVRWLLDPILGASSEYLLFYFSVMLAALIGGSGPAVLAIGLGAFSGFSVFAALGHLETGSRGEVVRLAVFLLFGGAVAVVSRWLRKAQAEVRAGVEQQAEIAESLRQSEERALQAAQFPEENPNPVLRIAADGRVLYANLAAERVLTDEGWEHGSHAPSPVHELAMRALNSGEPTETDLECRGLVYSFSCVPVANREYVNLYGRNVTAARRTERAFRESEARLRQSNAELDAERARWQALVEGIADEVWACDAEGRMSLVNIAAVTAMGLPEFEGKPVEAVLEEVDILDPDGSPRPADQAPLLRSLRGEIVHGEEIMRHRRTGRTRFRQFSSAPIRDAAGAITAAVAIVRDITEYKRASEEIVRLNAALVQDASELQAAKVAAEQANRAKDQFLAVLSHELRTPLTPVLTGIALLEADPALSAQARQYLEVLRRNVKLESRLIDDLLDLTRITRGKIELDRRRIELCTVINGAVEVCRPDLDARRLHFGIDWGPRPYVVDVDPGRLEQVFWNLIQNAIKFTPHGGCVGVICRPDRDQVVIEVNDSGIGIEPEALGRVFEAFHQANTSRSRQFGGLGLGLTISKALIEMHGGTIEAHSEGRERGATFRVRLPLVRAGMRAESGTGVLPERRSAAGHRSLRILLVEDHGDTSEMLANVLRLEGHEVETSGDVTTALDIASRGTFDVLVSDLGLPDGSGLDLMRQLRLRGIGLPGIALTGYGREEDIEQSRAAGFDAHLVKPVEPEHLLGILDRVVRRGLE